MAIESIDAVGGQKSDTRQSGIVRRHGKPKPGRSSVMLPLDWPFLSQTDVMQRLAELETVFQSAPVGLCVLDRRLRFVRVNDALAAINGLSVEDHIGKTVRQILPDLADKAESLARHILDTGQPVQDEVFCGTTPAEPNVQHWWSEEWLPLRDKESQVVAFSISVKDITRQRQAEEELHMAKVALERRVQERTAELNNTVEALQKTKSYLLQAHRIASMGTWEWEFAGDTLSWSDEVYPMFGVDPEKKDLTCDWFLSHVHPDDRESVKQSIDSAIDKNTPYAVEHRIVRPDGRKRIVKQHAVVVCNASHTPIRMLGTIQDVTDDRQKESRLHAQELELQAKAELLELAHDSIIVHNLDGQVTFWNRGAENLYGWKRHEALGAVTHELLKTQFSEPLLKTIAAVSATGKWEGELVHRTKSGKHVVVESRWAVQKDEQGKPMGILVIDRDNTERKSYEAKAQEARRYAESIIETVPESLVVLDSKLKVLSANKAFYTLFNLNPANTEGRYVYQLANKRLDIPELRQLLEMVLSGNKSFENYKIEYAAAPKTANVLLLNGRRIVRNSQKTDMILLAIQDITLRQQQEQRIRELTEELLNAEEEQRLEVATALHDSIGQMLAFSKCELAQLIKDPSLRTDDRLEHLHHSITQSLKESRKLTTDLGSPTLEMFGLESALEELAEHFHQEHGITCDFKVPEFSNSLDKKVELVLYRSVKELLCNIAKHAKARQVTITSTIVDGAYELTVSDDGRGFDPDTLDKKSKKNKSFGLLSIRHRLTTFGGSLTLTSQKHNGTTVALRVPLKQPQ